MDKPATASSSTTTTSTASTSSIPANKYDDYVIEGLSLYEMYREARHPVDSTTTLPIRILNKDLSCPICLNIIHNTQTVMECLHRFCSGCMTKSLRLGKKECPTCRIPCSSRRNLRPDPNFDALIRVLYPNLEQYEQQEESFIQQINNEYAIRSASVEEGMKRQQLASKRHRERNTDYVKEKRKDKEKEKDKNEKEIKKEPKPKKPKTETSSVNSPPPSSTSAPTSTTSTTILTPPPVKPRQPVPPPQDDVSIAIAPYPGETTLTFLPRPFLRIPAAACVKHVTKFLALKFPTIDPTTLKVVLGTGVSDSVKFAKQEVGEGLTVELEDLDIIKKENKALSEDTSLPTLRAAWKRRDEILLLYYLLPKEAVAEAEQQPSNSSDPKISIMTVQ